MAIKSAKKSIYLAILPIAVALFLALTTTVWAADPTFLVSWKASDYAPVGFSGKIFPINQTKIDVSFELVGNNDFDAGKIIDLSKGEIRWSVNGKMMLKSTGTKTFSFITNDASDTETNLKISAEYFDKNANYSYFVDKYITIPLASPDVVVSYKNIGASLAKGAANFFNAMPYFFNSPLQEISPSWNVNGQDVTPDPSDIWTIGVNLSQDYPSGSDIKIVVGANDVLNQGASVSRTFHFLSK